MENKLSSQIIVFGAGGLGKTIVSVLQASGYNAFGLLDDNPKTWGEQILGVPVLGSISKIDKYAGYGVVMGISDNKLRKQVARKYSNLNWIIVRSTSAYINPSAKIGKGTVIFAGAVIGADVTIGEHTIASANITIGHDAVIEDFVHVAPGVQIAGSASVGCGTMLGMSCVVCPKINIGKDVILGAGAVAVKDIPSGSIAFGMPAKIRNKT